VAWLLITISIALVAITLFLALRRKPEVPRIGEISFEDESASFDSAIGPTKRRLWEEQIEGDVRWLRLKVLELLAESAEADAEGTQQVALLRRDVDDLAKRSRAADSKLSVLWVEESLRSQGGHVEGIV
jgi:hypothetical protein